MSTNARFVVCLMVALFACFLFPYHTQASLFTSCFSIKEISNTQGYLSTHALDRNNMGLCFDTYWDAVSKVIRPKIFLRQIDLKSEMGDEEVIHTL